MSTGANGIKECEVCGNDRLTPVLNLGLHPMCDDLVPIGDARVCREYPIEILLCQTCVTAHQRFQVPKHELFPATYHYRSRFTADVLDGMAGLVSSCVDRFGSIDGKTVLDVGCNDGSLLDFFRKRGAITIGVEPTGAYIDAEAKGHTTFNAFLCEGVAETIVAQHGHPHFIAFTNVFAHIENLAQVIASLKILMSSQTVIIIENHYLGAILSGNQFDTFYHEHPRSYSYTSFVHIARALNRELVDVQFPSRYGGNIRVFMAPAERGSREAVKEELLARESGIAEEFAGLRTNIAKWQEAKSSSLARLVREGGPMKAKAFPGRAAILVKMLALSEASVAAVYEKAGSLKVGHYLPGTRIPILSEDELFSADDTARPLLNLAWHISHEIRGYVKSRGYTGPVVDILSASDFSA